MDKSNIAIKLFFSLFVLCVSVVSNAQEVTRNRWTYDFVVPDSGSFGEAIHRANAREDLEKRFRIFIKSNYYIVPGDSDTISTVEKGDTIYFPSPITTLKAKNTSIIGENWKDTKIVNIPVHEGIGITSTLCVKNADSTYIQDVEFWCNFKNDVNAFANRAVALNEKNCKGNILKNVSLLSTQDTYYTNDRGSTYLEDCTIFGTVDFICGGGTVFFNNCDIVMRDRMKKGSKNIITAASTLKRLKHGYIFNSCRVTGPEEQANKYFLGRPWKNAPQVVFLNTEMNVAPCEAGWRDMHGTLPRLFAEYNSHLTDGTKVDASKRKTLYKDDKGKEVSVKFKGELTEEESQEYTLEKVFGKWNPQEKCKLVPAPKLKAKGRKTLQWKHNPEAYCYAICIDGDVVSFTTDNEYVVPAETEEGACFSIRCANWYGGLGEASNEVVYPNR